MATKRARDTSDEGTPEAKKARSESPPPLTVVDDGPARAAAKRWAALYAKELKAYEHHFIVLAGYVYVFVRTRVLGTLHRGHLKCGPNVYSAETLTSLIDAIAKDDAAFKRLVDAALDEAKQLGPVQDQHTAYWVHLVREWVRHSAQLGNEAERPHAFHNDAILQTLIDCENNLRSNLLNYVKRGKSDFVSPNVLASTLYEDAGAPVAETPWTGTTKAQKEALAKLPPLQRFLAETNMFAEFPATITTGFEEFTRDHYGDEDEREDSDYDEGEAREAQDQQIREETAGLLNFTWHKAENKAYSRSKGAGHWWYDEYERWCEFVDDLLGETGWDKEAAQPLVDAMQFVASVDFAIDSIDTLNWD